MPSSPTCGGNGGLFSSRFKSMSMHSKAVFNCFAAKKGFIRFPSTPHFVVKPPLYRETSQEKCRQAGHLAKMCQQQGVR